MNAAKKTNAGVAAVKDAMANVNSAVANESAALSAVYSAYDEESAAQTAYDTAKGQIYSGWQSDYNDFRAEAATNATTLASAQAKQTVAEKDVNDATAAVASQSAAVKAQRAAEDAANNEVYALKEAGYATTSDQYKVAWMLTLKLKRHALLLKRS